MSRKLPPLNALRAFEATSRHLSAKAAADELCVTPAAISHQIKALESHLGLVLFKRLNRQLLLTDAGQRYAAVLQNVFKHLLDETQKITKSVQQHLTVSVEPSFAMYWLLPRLNKFRQAHPELELRITASYEVVDFKKDDADVAIRWGRGRYAGLTSILLFRNEVSPVCSPELLKKHPIRKPNDLQHHTLLHETAAIGHPDFPDWQKWLAAAKADKVNANSGLIFETGYLLIQAAIDGQGVALERNAFVEAAVKAGRLVRPFALSLMESNNAYYLVFPEDRQQDNKIITFLKWLKAEIKSYPKKK